ncbi:cupin [Rhizobium lentis]|uniref:cupin domain-containing protein n=1 Tax=Rhizobium TaxID=379 RepID=UPI00160A0B3E|nr:MULTISPECIES: cupin [Rhizobium]MBB3354727.1 quercetin dioxygenase-like cupin family protein [Rhizobium sp. BK049]MBX5133249.1 cupin [Rhizobium lentis]MBX5142445.1 cupin [Rhizobium lentis]MBX5152941.1 cupin [Rhizobium lentis]
MKPVLKTDRMSLAALAFAAVVLGAGLPAASAMAGECPADQVTEDGMKPGPMMPKGVSDSVVKTIDLSSKGEAWKGSMLRMRKLVVQPGGIVPWHSHEMRPANILIISGSITEYSSTCKVPILHKKGEVTAEFGHLSHWWKNNGKASAVLYSSDILSPEMHTDDAAM